MDFPSPTEISLNQVTQELIEDVAVLAHRVNKLRPLAREVIEQIEGELLEERVYNSNAIEGNTLTLRETKRILEAGDAIGVGHKREATEVINLGNAIAQLQTMIADRDAWCDASRFLEIHKTLLSGVMDDAVGVLRSQDVMIGGAKHQPPDSSKVPGLVDDLFTGLRNETTVGTVPLATWVHWAITRIHPFVDGNGRMARLWQDLVLFGNQLTAAVIRQQDRNEYYKALTSADDGDFNHLTQLITRSLLSNLNIYLNAQREVDEVRGWAAHLVGETHARQDQKRQLEYLRWVREMEQLRDAFHRCATQITNVSDGTIEVQLQPFDIVDQSTWESLRSGAGAARTWFFWVNFRRDLDRIQYCFFYGHHMTSDLDRNLPGVGPSACLLVSEQQGDGKAVRLGEVDSPVTLRELLLVDNKLVRKRYDTGRNLEVYDVDVDQLDVAREFIAEVLLTKLP